jgi:hypothetical protein
MCGAEIKLNKLVYKLQLLALLMTAGMDHHNIHNVLILAAHWADL